MGTESVQFKTVRMYGASKDDLAKPPEGILPEDIVAESRVAIDAANKQWLASEGQDRFYAFMQAAMYPVVLQFRVVHRLSFIDTVMQQIDLFRSVTEGARKCGPAICGMDEQDKCQASIDNLREEFWAGLRNLSEDDAAKAAPNWACAFAAALNELFDRTRQLGDICDLLHASAPDWVCQALIPLLKLLVISCPKAKKVLRRHMSAVLTYVGRLMNPEFPRPVSVQAFAMLGHLTFGNHSNEGLELFGTHAAQFVKFTCSHVSNFTESMHELPGATRLQPLLGLISCLEKTDFDKILPSNKQGIKDALIMFAWPLARKILMVDPMPVCWWADQSEFLKLITTDELIEGDAPPVTCPHRRRIESSMRHAIHADVAYGLSGPITDNELAQRTCAVMKVIHLIDIIVLINAAKPSDMDERFQKALIAVLNDPRAHGYMADACRQRILDWSNRKGRQKATRLWKSVLANRANTYCLQDTRSAHTSKCGNPACWKMEEDDKGVLKPGIFQLCSQCMLECYCSAQCQKKAWKHHKKVCMPAGPSSQGAGSERR